jgi:hypothetical protein
MPADYLSRLTSAENDNIAEITECLDPFQPDLKDLQKADQQLQHMNHFQIHGQRPTSVSKSEGNYLQNLAPKIFQDTSNIVWIRLDDYKYPRTALFQRGTEKGHFARHITTNSGATTQLSKPTFEFHPKTTGLKCIQTS